MVPDFLTVLAVSAELDDAIARALDEKTKPVGALGVLESLAAQAARVQGTLTPVIEGCSLTLFAGDHGIAAEGVSAYPQAVTGQMVGNFLAGGAAANVLARTHGVQLQVVDAGVAGEPIQHPALVSRRIGPGTHNSSQEPAMTAAQCHEALRAGCALGEAVFGEVAAFGEMGIANTSAASLIAHKLTGIDLVSLIGRGAGLDDVGVAHKCAVLTRAAARTASPMMEPLDALREYAGFEMVMMAGAMIGAARKGRLVLVDGFIATASALAAVRLAPTLREYLIFAHTSAESGHQRLLAAMQARPLLNLEMRLGEGTGALLAWPLVRSAAAVLRDMASFSDAGVSQS